MTYLNRRVRVAHCFLVALPRGFPNNRRDRRLFLHSHLLEMVVGQFTVVHSCRSLHMDFVRIYRKNARPSPSCSFAVNNGLLVGEWGGVGLVFKSLLSFSRAGKGLTESRGLQTNALKLGLHREYSWRFSFPRNNGLVGLSGTIEILRLVEQLRLI